MSGIDYEQAVMTWLASRFTSARVTVEMPSKIVGPTIRVLGLGGPNDFVLDKPSLAIDCFDLGRTVDGKEVNGRIYARALAYEVRDAMLWSLPGSAISGGYVTKVNATLPAWRPYDNTNVRRFGATYQLFCR